MASPIHPNLAHFGGNVPSVMGVIGTLGTSDTKGTAKTLPIGVRAATGAVMVHISGTDVEIGGGAGGSNVNVVTGTQQTLGTVGVLNAGSVVVTTGTIGNINQIGTVTVVNAGSIVQTAGTVTTGTLQNLVSGTVTVGVGTVNVTTGSIVVTSGTIGDLDTVGTLGVVEAGSINLLKAGTITRVEGGSVVVTVGTTTVTTGTIVQASGTVTTGSIVQTAGTVTTMLAGTLTALANGTITAGTVRVNWRPTAIGSTFGTLGTAGGSFFGTLVAASGAGTEIMVKGLSIVCQTGTPDVRILVGTAITGANVLAGGAWVPGGGIRAEFVPPHETAANSEITYHFVNAGTAFITLQYWNEV